MFDEAIGFDFKKYQRAIVFLFISSFIVFQPILKYFEYVLDFQRINFSFFIVILFSMYLLSISRDFSNRYSFNLFFSFWILVFVSGVQIISMPWAIYYGLEGSIDYLKIISKTLFCYWMFWFSGFHIKSMLDSKRARVFFTISWILTVFLIFISSLNNDIFRVILEGEVIYLMLADCFAVLSIFVLIYHKKFDLLIIPLSSLALFALWSRASLYSFLIIAMLYMIKEHRFKTLLLLLIGIYFLDTFLMLKEDRMFVIIFGGFDTSQSIREKFLHMGLNDIKMVWPFGHFMGDVNSNYGRVGTYIHSYLSFLRQFGLIPFLALSILVTACYLKIVRLWLLKGSRDINFLFYFTTFVLVEIMFARSYLHSFLWMGLSGISMINNKE